MDERMRRLERMAACGDGAAVDALYRARAAGRAPWPDNRMQALLGWNSHKWDNLDDWYQDTHPVEHWHWEWMCDDCGQIGYGNGRWGAIEHLGDCKNPKQITPCVYLGEDEDGDELWRRAQAFQGPRQRCNDALFGIIAEGLGGTYRNKSWGELSGEVIIDGLRFVVLPIPANFYNREAAKAAGKSYRYKGQHRLKVECPGCPGRLFGPAKWLQHYKHKHAK